MPIRLISGAFPAVAAAVLPVLPFFLLVLAVLACGATPGSTPVVAIPADAGGRTEAGANETVPPAPALILDSGPAPALDEAGPDESMACAVSVQTAQPVPLDLEFLLDTSGSMSDLAAPGQSKWNALATALAAFVRAPASAGIGVGVRYFPVAPAGVPASCASSAECGANGPCLVGQCDDGTDFLCATDDDCPFGGPCRSAGACEEDVNVSCVLPGRSCGSDANGFDLGLCAPQPRSYCAVSDSCAAADYTRAAVDVASLPGAATAIVASLDAQQPHGGTPTPAALAGVIEDATQYARAHSTHTVVAVLATDGVPNETADPLSGLCAPVDPAMANGLLERTAAAAAAATPPVETFTIGVFAPDEVDSGAASLTAIAAAGGSERPFVVETGAGDDAGVEAQLAAAFERIRQATLPCDYAVPSSEGGVPDFTRLNVRYTPGSGQTLTVPHVETAAACGTADGWYYAMDSDAGASPRSIDVCPTTCATLRADAAGRVDVVLGCRTVVR
jgi:hypothetical protein